MFLQETKVKAFFLLLKNFVFGFSNDLGVDCVGKSEELALLWKEDIDF